MNGYYKHVEKGIYKECEYKNDLMDGLFALWENDHVAFGIIRNQRREGICAMKDGKQKQFVKVIFKHVRRLCYNPQFWRPLDKSPDGRTE